MDAAIVTTPSEKQEAQLLLIQRKNAPCKGMWALPGGFVDESESLDAAAARELQEETSLDSSRVRMIQAKRTLFFNFSRSLDASCVVHFFKKNMQRPTP